MPNHINGINCEASAASAAPLIDHKGIKMKQAVTFTTIAINVKRGKRYCKFSDRSHLPKIEEKQINKKFHIYICNTPDEAVY